MKKIVLVSGAIAGVIVATLMIVTIAIYKKNGNFEGGMIYGYASMILAFSMIFVGIKNYRDKYNNGLISFGKAFKIGLYITLIASTIYVIVWLIEFYFFIPEFIELYAKHSIDKLKAAGATQVEIASKTTEMASFSAMYKNPFFNILMTYMEIIPVGLLITLISSFILKRKALPVV